MSNHNGNANKMVSDTPRTDDESFFMHHSRYDYCKADLARQLERELNAANHHIKRLEEAVQELKVANEYAWQKNGKLNERIRRLIKLGLETAEYGLQNHREQWEQEEEL